MRTAAYGPGMTRALCLITRWIAVAHDRWRAEVAKRRPLSAEIDALKETVARLRSENELLRGRLRRVPLRRRPRYGGYERLLILLHEARYGLSLRATARAFVLSGQTLINWRKDAAKASARLVRGRRPINALPDVVAYASGQPRWRGDGDGCAACRRRTRRGPTRWRRISPGASHEVVGP